MGGIEQCTNLLGTSLMQKPQSGLVSTKIAQLHFFLQVTQPSLTNRATRLEVSQGHKTWYHSICKVWFPISVL